MEEITIPQIIQDKCPIWSARIMNQGFNALNNGSLYGDRYTHIGNPTCCVVGEAHGFNDQYWVDEPFELIIDTEKPQAGGGCIECTSYSRGFHKSTTLYQSVAHLQMILNKFAKHLEECHNELEYVPEIEKQAIEVLVR